MVAVSARYPPFQKSLCKSPPSRNTGDPNLRHDGGVANQLAMRFPSVERISFTTAFSRSYRNPIRFSVKSTSYLSHLDLSIDYNFISIMADSDARKEIKPADDLGVVKDTKETKKSPEIPPPPEKPLPGDCCGSGCFRCVWDVYYEELEEYNKLYKSDSDSTIGSKVS